MEKVVDGCLGLFFFVTFVLFAYYGWNLGIDILGSSWLGVLAGVLLFVVFVVIIMLAVLAYEIWNSPPVP